jgi:hypothetical protein
MRHVQVAALVVTLLAACADPTTTEMGAGGPVLPQAVTVTRLTLTPDAITLAPGATQQFSVSATLSNGTTSAAPSVRYAITGGWISNGLYTAGTATGAFRVIATSADGPADTSAVTISTGPPPPTLSLTAVPTTIITGQSSTLSWTSTNATSCTASNGWTGAQPTSGTLVVSPVATATFTLGCSGAGGTISRSAMVAVNAPPPPTLTFTAQPAAITTGQSSTLTWTGANATSCTASGGWTGTQLLAGTLVVSPTATTTYTLACTGPGGTLSQSATVTVTAPLPTLSLAALPPAIITGQSSTLTWVSVNTTDCTASIGWAGAQATSGSLVVSPTATTIYALACTGPGGTVSRSDTLTVNPVPAPTVALAALPTAITIGQSSTLTWSSTNATGCTATGGWTGVQATSGTMVMTPTATTIYTLACTGTGGTATQSATVTVGPIPPPTLSFTALPASISAGQSSTLSWTSTNATSCTATGGWTGSQLPSGTLMVSPTVLTIYGLDCAGPGGTITQSATVTVTTPPPPPPPGGYTYPLSVGPTNRYLIDQTGKPFLMVGDAVWSLIAQLTDGDAETYFATRQTQGFTLAMVNLIEHKFSTAAPKNAYGQPPFTGRVFSTPNDAYFSHVDAVVRSAASHGIVVMLDVIYLGASCSNEGWCAEVKAATTADMTAYGTYLGNRYQSFDNIIWQIGGDTDPGVVAPKLTALVNGILSADTRHPFAAHNGSWETGVDPWGSAAWLTLNDVYTYSTTLYANVLAAYNRTPVKPVFLIEAKYENETEWNVTQPQLRSQFYWTLLSGGFGQVYGNCPVWNFDAPGHGAYCPQSGWKAQLTSQGARNMQSAAAVVGARHWWTLVPDAGHAVLTAGFGSGTTYATTAYASDGSTALAYLPTSRAVTVSGSRLTGASMTVTWYNPATGVATPLGSFATSAPQSFTPPATGDWVLVLDAQSP